MRCPITKAKSYRLYYGASVPQYWCPLGLLESAIGILNAYMNRRPALNHALWDVLPLPSTPSAISDRFIYSLQVGWLNFSYGEACYRKISMICGRAFSSSLFICKSYNVGTNSRSYNLWLIKFSSIRKQNWFVPLQYIEGKQLNSKLSLTMTILKWSLC